MKEKYKAAIGVLCLLLLVASAGFSVVAQQNENFVYVGYGSGGNDEVKKFNSTLSEVGANSDSAEIIRAIYLSEYLYAINGNGKVFKINRTDMTTVSTVTVDSDNAITDMVVEGDFIYTIGGNEISKINKSLGVEQTITPTEQGYDVAVMGDYLYASTQETLLKINLTTFSQVDSTNAEWGTTGDLEAENGYVYGSDNNPGRLFKYDAGSLSFEGSYSLKTELSLGDFDVHPNTGNIYLPNGTSIEVVDQGLTEINSTDIGGNAISTIKLDEDVIFVSGSSRVPEFRYYNHTLKEQIGNTQYGTDYASATSDFGGDDNGDGGGDVDEADKLRIETREYLEHNTTVPFEVWLYNNSTDSYDNVTTDPDLNVTVENTSVVTVSGASITSTNDTTINQVTWVNATWEPTGVNDSQEVVVANETIENVDILPPMQKFTASVGTPDMQVVLIATGVGAGIGLLATSLAGIGGFTLVIIAGWLGGYSETHTLIAGLLIALFVGLNVSQLVEFNGR
jgi:hypothetical protein